MSALNFGHFAYQRRKECLLRGEKENSLQRKKKWGLTPNKAPFQSPNSIPDSLLSGTTSRDTTRTRFLPSSTSNREDHMATAEMRGRPTSKNLFSKFQTSVRKKRGENEPVKLLVQENDVINGENDVTSGEEGAEAVTSWTSWSKRKKTSSQAVLNFECEPQPDSTLTSGARKRRFKDEDLQCRVKKPRRCMVILSDDESLSDNSLDLSAALAGKDSVLPAKRKHRQRLCLDDTLESDDCKSTGEEACKPVVVCVSSESSEEDSEGNSPTPRWISRCQRKKTSNCISKSTKSKLLEFSFDSSSSQKNKSPRSRDTSSKPCLSIASQCSNATSSSSQLSSQTPSTTDGSEATGSPSSSPATETDLSCSSSANVISNSSDGVGRHSTTAQKCTSSDGVVGHSATAQKCTSSDGVVGHSATAQKCTSSDGVVGHSATAQKCTSSDRVVGHSATARKRTSCSSHRVLGTPSTDAPRLTTEDVIDLVCDSPNTENSESSTVALSRDSTPQVNEVDILEVMEKKCLDNFIVIPSDDDEDDGYSNSQKKALLEFLNSCTVEEACEISGCSATKAKRLISCQPFTNWQHLIETLLSKKGLTEQILDGCLQLLRERKVLGKLLTKCRVISAKIQRLNSSTESTLACGVKCLKQPSILSSNMQLKSYQLIGLNWLALLHSQNLNGILADEMGLGKTMQAISFLAYLRECGCNGPFLIVVPSSTIDNWARELKRWCPAFRVLTYWGSQTERADMRSDVLCGVHYAVILTTYTLCIGQAEDRRFFRKLSLKCLILDEGHMVKNMASQRYNHLMKIKAERRLLLTGTPVQNNLQELMSLLSFVMPEVFSEFSDQLKKTFTRARRDEASAYYQEQVGQAKQIMRPFILRRLKADVYSELPAKIECVEYPPLTELQLQLYSAVMERARREMKTQTEKEQYCRSMSVITDMRKIANHPLLVRHRYTDEQLRQMSVDILQDPSHSDADPQLVFEDMTVMTDFELHNLCLFNPALSGHTLPSEVFGQSAKLIFLSQKLSILKEQGDRVLLFSQFTSMLDIVEVFLQQGGHSYLRIDGSTPINQRQQLIDQYNESDHIFIFLLSTKAGGLGINLTSANVVIIHDIDFNPYNDKQAEDRCHRVGQTREVHVTRLIGKGTVEEDILQCANMKLRLEQDINSSSSNELPDSDIASVLKKALGLQ